MSYKEKNKAKNGKNPLKSKYLWKSIKYNGKKEKKWITRKGKYCTNSHL